MTKNNTALPGLGLSEPELLQSAESFVAHAAVTIGELIEISEDDETTEIDGQDLSQILGALVAMLGKIRTWKK